MRTTPHPGLDVTEPLGFKAPSQSLPPRPCLSKLLSTLCQRGKRTPPQARISRVLISFTSQLCCDPVGRARRTTVLRSVMLAWGGTVRVPHTHLPDPHQGSEYRTEQYKIGRAHV